MEEIWKDVVGYEGIYKVSNLGRVKSLNYKKTGIEKVLRNQAAGHGYMQVRLCKNGICKFLFVHRLVAKAFLENFDNLPEINHKDKNKRNNCVENLEWCTRKYNMEYGFFKKRISSKGIPVFCVEMNKVFSSAAKAQQETSIDNSHIIKCCKGVRATAGGYHWRYVRY